MRVFSRLCAVLSVLSLLSSAAPPADTAEAQEPQHDWTRNDPRDGLLTPIPDHGAVPPIIELAARQTEDELAFRKRSRGYAVEIRRIRHEYLGRMRVAELRERGIHELRSLTDPAAFMPLIEELSDQKDDVRLAVLDHFSAQGDDGQAALAWVAIHDPGEAFRHEAQRRMVSPAPDPVLRVLGNALRSNRHDIANHAGTLAGSLRALQAIPLLIFAQATVDPFDEPGDLAWIAVATQRAFVARIEPIVGSGVGAFQVIPGVVSEGAILRVVDAVVIFYRTEVHRSLVMMTTDDWGQSTAHLGYDMRQWWTWYNDQYLPRKNAEIAAAALQRRAGG